MERFLDEQEERSIIFNHLNSRRHKLSLENQVAMIGTSLVTFPDGGRQQKALSTRKTTTTYKQPSKQVKNTTPEPWYYMSHWISQMKHLHWSFSALPSVSHFTLRLTKRLARILITAHLGGNVGQFRLKGWGGFGSLQGIISHQSTAWVIKMSMMMNTENNYASKEISANHDQYDLAAVADDNDEG